MDTSDMASGNRRTVAQPALRDAVASASYDYDAALTAYQAALASPDAEKQLAAEARLQDATRRLSTAEAALVSARNQAHSVSFSDLLNDPSQQLDQAGAVLASVLEYRSAASITASVASIWVDHAPPAAKTGQYVHDHVLASTVAATAAAG